MAAMEEELELLELGGVVGQGSERVVEAMECSEGAQVAFI